LSSLEDRIISDLWKKYNRAKTDYGIANQEIDNLKRTITNREKDRILAAHWLDFYKKQLELRGIDVGDD